MAFAQLGVDSPGLITDIEDTVGVGARVANTAYPVGHVLRYGADPTGATYSTQAFKDAIAAASYIDSAGIVDVPKGTYLLDETLLIHDSVIIQGHAQARNSVSGSNLVFDAGITGMVFHARNTTCDTDGTNQTTRTATTWPNGADRTGKSSVLRHIHLFGNGTFNGGRPTGDGASHGVRIRTSIVMEGVWINNFEGDGIHADVDFQAGGALEGNANLLYVNRCSTRKCGGKGVYVNNSDVNAGVFILHNVTECGGIGIHDSSFLGNTWLACHEATNVGKSYVCDDPNARSVFLGCYTEGDSGGPPEIRHPAMWLGGQSNGAGNAYSGTSDSGTFMEGQRHWGRMDLEGVVGVAEFEMQFMRNGGNGPAITLIATGDNSAGINLASYDDGSGDWVIGNHANSLSKANMFIMTDNTTGEFGRSGVGIDPGNIRFERFWLGDSDANARMVESGTVVPSSGDYAVGDIKWNRGGDGPLLWKCFEAGSPGTWHPILNNNWNVLADSATPSVDAGHLFTTGGTTTITNLTGGYEGQQITIEGNHAVTITDNANIRLNGSSNFVMAINDTLTLVKLSDTIWTEIARMVR